MGCNSCNECGQSYVDTCGCNFLGCGSTTITREENNITVCSPEYNVISPNETIDVVKVVEGNVTTFEIEKECCEDKLVGACANDTNPGTLFEDKLRVDTSGPLTYNLVNCPGDAHVNIGFDVSKLNAPDTKVAVNASCTGKYLQDSLTVVEGEGMNGLGLNYMEFNDIPGCQLALQVNPRKLFRAEIRCTGTWIMNLPDSNDATGFDGISNQATTYVTTHEENMVESTFNNLIVQGVTIPRSGWYQINMQGSYITSGRVHTIRNQIINVGTSASILDSRDEAARRKDLDSSDTINTQNELNKSLSDPIHSAVVGMDGKELALSYAWRGKGFGGSITKYLEAGTELCMLVKYYTTVKDEFMEMSPGKIVFTKEGEDLTTNGPGAGTGWSIHELPSHSLTD